MLIDKSSLLRRALIVAAIAAFAATGTSPCRAFPANAQQDASPPSPPVSTYQSHSSEEDHAHTEAIYPYTSDADRAKDALLTTEVKTAVATAGVTDGHAV